METLVVALQLFSRDFLAATSCLRQTLKSQVSGQCPPQGHKGRQGTEAFTSRTCGHEKE